MRGDAKRIMMTSRERIKATLRHEEPDRVPFDLGGSQVTGIHVDEYCALAEYFGLDVLPPKVYDPWQMLAIPDPLMLKALSSDIIVVENYLQPFGLRSSDWKPWTTYPGNRVLMSGDYNPFEDKKGYLHIQNAAGKSLAQMAPGGLYYDIEDPTQMTSDWVFMDPDQWKKSIPLYTDEHLRIMQKNAKALYENTDFALCGSFLKGGLGTNAIFAGHTVCDWYCILSMEPQYANEILRATAERAVENCELYLQALNSYIDILLLSGTDYGSQKAEMFRPEIFKELHMPNYRLITDYVHKNYDVKIAMHSCGSIYNIIEHIIEAGIDILNPVHVNTANMDPQRLKDRFGSRIVFWGGGVDTQTVLPYGTPEEVAEQAKERIKIFAPGGGFIFTPVHNMQYGVPPKNVESMIKAVIEFGKYPLA